MFKLISLVLSLVLIEAKSYPKYSQCDAQWKNEKLGTSDNNICQVGALVTAVSIGLSSIGINHTPSTLNQWLKDNKGYLNKDDFVWAALNQLGITFNGKITNSYLKNNIDDGNLVIMNVNKGQHWVLATGYRQNTIFVIDPLFTNIRSYEINAVVNGNSGVYIVPPSFSPIVESDSPSTYKHLRSMQEPVQ